MGGEVNQARIQPCMSNLVWVTTNSAKVGRSYSVLPGKGHPVLTHPVVETKVHPNGHAFKEWVPYFNQ